MVDDLKVDSYGVRRQFAPDNFVDVCTEQVIRNGFTVLESGFDDQEIASISESFESVCEQYRALYTTELLMKLGEIDTVRMPLTFCSESMLKVALNARLQAVVGSLIDGSYVLNQQNLIINPNGREYSQSSWHRDLPYQHFTSSTPLAVNAIYCVDDFARENGASFVLPGSHLFADFPSDEFVLDNAVQISAPAGSFIILNCMTYHKGGFNSTECSRRAINHVFNIPYFKQQIALSENIETDALTDREKSILGVGMSELKTVEDFLHSRVSKLNRGVEL